MVGWDDWKSTLASPETADADDIHTGEQFLAQYSHIFGLDWHWDGLHSHTKLDQFTWHLWISRFNAWIKPWKQRETISAIDSVYLFRPSDLLWFSVLREHARGICLHRTVFQTATMLFPGAQLTRCDSESEISSILSSLGYLRADASDLASASFLGRHLFCSERPNRLLPWDKDWSVKPRWPLKDIHCYIKYPKPWREVDNLDRSKIASIAFWLNGISPLQWVKTYGQGIARALPRLDCARDEITLSRIYENIKGISTGAISLFPRCTEWKELHRWIFEGVYPFAGMFRNGDEIVVAGRNATVQPRHIDQELECLFEQGMAAWTEAKTRTDRFAVVAWSHLRFQLIHPFFDGNGHVGRLWLARHAHELGCAATPEWSQTVSSEYKNCMAEFGRTGSTDRWIAWLSGLLGIAPTIIQLPFRVEPLLQMFGR